MTGESDSFTVLQLAMFAARIPTVAMANVLHRIAWRQGVTGWCALTLTQLASDCCCGLTTVKSALAWAEENTMLEVRNGVASGGNGRPPKLRRIVVPDELRGRAEAQAAGGRPKLPTGTTGDQPSSGEVSAVHGRPKAPTEPTTAPEVSAVHGRPKTPEVSAGAGGGFGRSGRGVSAAAAPATQENYQENTKAAAARAREDEAGPGIAKAVPATVEHLGEARDRLWRLVHDARGGPVPPADRRAVDDAADYVWQGLEAGGSADLGADFATKAEAIVELWKRSPEFHDLRSPGSHLRRYIAELYENRPAVPRAKVAGRGPRVRARHVAAPAEDYADDVAEGRF